MRLPLVLTWLGVVGSMQCGFWLVRETRDFHNSDAHCLYQSNMGFEHSKHIEDTEGRCASHYSYVVTLMDHCPDIIH